MARVARRSGLWDEAERILDEYWAERGDDELLVFERLLLRAARGELETASPPLSARIRAGGADATAAREALVTGLINRFRWAEAAAAINDWLAGDPDNTTALLLRGKLQEQRQLSDPALGSYRRVVELDPDHDEARVRLTTTLLQRFYGEEALGHLARLRERLPDHPDVAYQWVVALGLQGRTAEAREALEALLLTLPNHAGALAERGKYAALDGDTAAAVNYLGRAIQLDPGNLTVRYQHAQALARTGNTTEAARAEAVIDRLKGDLAEIDRLIAGPLQTTPNDPAVHHQIALIALRAGQRAEGLRWLQSALAVDPRHLPTHQLLVGYYQSDDNPVLAARHRAIAKQLASKQ
jgi:tetratricopeptide (TPR) repeat protein